MAGGGAGSANPATRGSAGCVVDRNGKVVPASDTVCRSVADVHGYLWRSLETCPGVEIVWPDDFDGCQFARST